MDVDKPVWRGVAGILDLEAIANVVIEDRHAEMLAGNDEILRTHDQHDLRIVVGVDEGPQVGEVGAAILRDRRQIDVIRGDGRANHRGHGAGCDERRRRNARRQSRLVE